MTKDRPGALVSPEQLTGAINYLEAHGWARHGVVLAKDGLSVSLIFDGGMIFDGDPKAMPPELLAMFQGKPNG